MDRAAMAASVEPLVDRHALPEKPPLDPGAPPLAAHEDKTPTTAVLRHGLDVATTAGDKSVATAGAGAGVAVGSSSSFAALLGGAVEKHHRPISSDREQELLLPLLCTEAVGDESSAVDDSFDMGTAPAVHVADDGNKEADIGVGQKRAVTPAAFPPPISLIGTGGKPWVHLRPVREDGRLVIKEVRIPTQGMLQISREDGRLKLHTVHVDDEVDVDADAGEGAAERS